MGTCTGAVGAGAAPVTYAFYLDVYGGTLPADAFSEALPAAIRCVGAITGRRAPDPDWDEGLADAWRRAACAAAEAFAEFGEGRVGGFSIGDFSVTNYQREPRWRMPPPSGSSPAQVSPSRGRGRCASCDRYRGGSCPTT